MLSCVLYFLQAGASAVVPEILEPSLQLAAAVLGEMKMPPEEVAASIDEFRRSHLGALRSLTRQAGTSLGYGYSSDEDETEGSPESAADMNVPGQAGAAA